MGPTRRSCQRSSQWPTVCAPPVSAGVMSVKLTIVINAEYAFVTFMRSEPSRTRILLIPLFY